MVIMLILSDVADSMKCSAKETKEGAAIRAIFLSESSIARLKCSFITYELGVYVCLCLRMERPLVVGLRLPLTSRKVQAHPGESGAKKRACVVAGGL